MISLELVVDANILFAAFIKDGTTRRILLTRTPLPLKLYTTPFILEESYKYRKILAAKTGLTESKIMELIFELIAASNIEIVSIQELVRFKDISEEISPRKNDMPYFAVALCKNCKIWSNDKPMRTQQDKVIVITTEELLSELYAST